MGGGGGRQASLVCRPGEGSLLSSASLSLPIWLYLLCLPTSGSAVTSDSFHGSSESELA